MTKATSESTKRPRVVALLGNGKIWMYSEIDLEILIIADNEGLWTLDAESEEVEKRFLDNAHIISFGKRNMNSV